MSEHIKQVHATVLDYLDTRSIDGFDTVVIQQDATTFYTVFVDVEQFPVVRTLHSGDMLSIGIDTAYEVCYLDVLIDGETSHDKQ